MSDLKKVIENLIKKQEFHYRQAEAYATAIATMQAVRHLEDGVNGTVFPPVKRPYSKRISVNSVVKHKKRKLFPIQFGRVILKYLQDKEDHAATGQTIKNYLEDLYGPAVVKKRWKKIRTALSSAVYLKNLSVQLDPGGDVLLNVYRARK